MSGTRGSSSAASAGPASTATGVERPSTATGVESLPPASMKTMKAMKAIKGIKKKVHYGCKHWNKLGYRLMLHQWLKTEEKKAKKAKARVEMLSCFHGVAWN